MTNNIRRIVPGGTYYFSVCLADPDSSLLVDEVDLLDMLCVCAKSSARS
jgi:hypothetical protein